MNKIKLFRQKQSQNLKKKMISFIKESVFVLVKKFEEEHIEYIPKKMLHSLMRELPHVFGEQSSLISLNNTSPIHPSHKNLFESSHIMATDDDVMKDAMTQGIGLPSPRVKLVKRRIETRRERRKAKRRGEKEAVAVKEESKPPCATASASFGGGQLSKNSLGKRLSVATKTRSAVTVLNCPSAKSSKKLQAPSK